MTEQRLDGDYLKSAICGMTSAVQINQGWEVTLPQVYHTGHAATVVVAKSAFGFVIHDNAYAAMLVSQHGHNVSDLTRQFIESAMRSYGCELEGLQVVRKCAALSDVPLSAVLVGCASRLIADQLLSANKLPLFDFKSQVVTKASEVLGARRIRTNQEVHGHLGGSYQVSAVILDEREAKPLAFIEPVSSADSVGRCFKEFYDISRNPNYAGIERVAIFNDEKAISSHDFLLMQEVSNPVRFSDSAKRFAAWATVQ